MREQTKMNKIVFQIMAGLALFFAALLLLGGVVTVFRYPPQSLWGLIMPAVVIMVLIVAGLGLFHLRKWAALAFSLLALFVSSWEINDALHPQRGYANWLGYLFGFLFAIPSILTVLYWRTLSWRGNQSPNKGKSVNHVF